jgi:integrase
LSPNGSNNAPETGHDRARTNHGTVLHRTPHRSNTIASYRDTFRLLLTFTRQHTGKPPSKLDLVDLDAVLIGRFLDHLEHVRHNSVRTRNNRLGAIHSPFNYAAFRHPEHAEVIQRVLAIPAKRTDRKLVTFLTTDEVNALLAAPDRTTWIGRRDHALIVVAIQTGLRVSELTALVNTESPWESWRLLALETRMESWEHNRYRGSRRHVAIRSRRRLRRCGWFVSCEPRPGNVMERSRGSLSSSAMGSSRCGTG